MESVSDLGRRSAPNCSQAQRGSTMRPPQSGGVFKSAAVEVLQRERRLMSTGEICRLALEWGLLKCTGKTPEATMASCLYGDLKRRDRLTVFVRPREGMFGLREWVEEGLIPEPSLDESSRVEKPPSRKRPAQRNAKGGVAAHGKRPPGVKRNVDPEVLSDQRETSIVHNIESTAALQQPEHQPAGFLRAPALDGAAGNGQRTVTMSPAMPGEKASFKESSSPLVEDQFSKVQPRLENQNSLVPSAQQVPSFLPPTALRAEALATQMETVVLETENTWGPHHPKTGKAYMMLYHSCRGGSLGSHSALRAREALLQAYKIMCINNQLELVNAGWQSHGLQTPTHVNGEGSSAAGRV